MHRNRENYENTSTPKRRRLGTGRILRPSLDIFHKKFSPVQPQLIESRQTISERCESPPIPCNQNEYLCDTGNNTSSSLSINVPQSPGIFECSVDCGEVRYLQSQIGKCSQQNHSSEKENKFSNHERQVLEEIEDISDDMFYSRLEVSQTPNINENELLTSRCDKYFRQNIQESFELVNQSICKLDTNQRNETSDLFETKDSFLLDIKDTCALVEENKKNVLDQNKGNNVPIAKNQPNNVNSFYGLPPITKGLFKTYRNIEKFYDWQEECLNLDAIRLRQNLIYALPTSGGKTLVAEVLMLREVLNRRKNALFILPFVAIVQEKIWSLSPFAVQLEFLVEEYAGGKGHIPPKKRRKRHSIYIATIEKGLALLRSLIELDRLDEIGLIVVDELHLVGEQGRGSTLETLLATVIFANKGIQIVGMSATIGNLPEVAQFLRATVFERHFRPVELTEFVKLGDMLHRITWGADGLQVVPERAVSYDYSAAAQALDSDRLGGLVGEVAPRGSCLVFCPTKRNCENVAALLCKMQRREMTEYRSEERRALQNALKSEGSAVELTRAVGCGVAFHHAGLAADERALLENAFRSGVISVICCTSTLAAGVNLPARRVIVRAPRVARDFLTLAAYRQMVGRAGRAGHCEAGESIIVCSAAEWPALREMLSGGVGAARSGLAAGAGAAAPELLLSAVALRLATTRPQLRRLLEATLLAVQAASLQVDIKQVCDASIRSLLQNGAIEVSGPTGKPAEGSDQSHLEAKCQSDTRYVYDDSELVVSLLGNAAIKGSLELSTTRLLLEDLETASRGLVLMGSCHLLYLVTPHDAAAVRPDYRHYYTLYCNLNEECLQTAKVLGITEKSAIRMITGKPITNVPEMVLSRFYIALILYDLWNELPLSTVVEKYGVGRGVVQQLVGRATARAAGAARVCGALAARWPLAALLAELAARWPHCAAPQLRELCALPNVRQARALQLWKAGYKTVEALARASPEQLSNAVQHLSRTAADHLISSARLMLIEKVENLRAEAEDVMEELNM